jgi:hypothetical protein
MGQFFAKRGGKSAKAVLAFLQWRFRGDQPSKAKLFDANSPESLASMHWNVSQKNWT